jgi:hypothetical protein
MGLRNGLTVEKESLLSGEYLRKLFLYDKDTGLFSRRFVFSRRHSRKVGFKNKNGYIVIAIDDVQYMAHRLAWLYIHNCWPPDQLDHKDHDKTNNRIDNLRPLSPRLNTYHRKIPIKGVFFDKTPRLKRRWVAYLGLKRLGRFETEEEALIARQKAFKELPWPTKQELEDSAAG